MTTVATARPEHVPPARPVARIQRSVRPVLPYVIASAVLAPPLGLALAYLIPLPLLGLLVLVGMAVLFWTRRSLLGPLFLYELVRLGRRRGTVLLRCGFLLLLSAALWSVYRNFSERFDEGIAHYGRFAYQMGYADLDDLLRVLMSKLAENFANTILILQFLAVLLLTPIAMAGSINEDRNNGTLDFLFASHLSNHEVILGKLMARLLALGVLLLAAVPVLAIIYVLGGIDVQLVLVGFAITFATLFHVGCLSIFCAVITRSWTGGVVLAYAMMIYTLVVGIRSGSIYVDSLPIILLRQFVQNAYEWHAFSYEWYRWLDWADLISRRPPAGTPNPLIAQLDMQVNVQFVPGLLYLLLAVGLVRVMHERFQFKKHKRKRGSLESYLHTVAGTSKYRPRLMPLDKHPLWCLVARTSLERFNVVLILVTKWFACIGLICWAVIYLGFLTFSGRPHGWALDTLRVVLAITTMFGLGLPWLATGQSAASAISRERERQTLISMQTLPFTTTALVWNKLLIVLWQFRWVLAAAMLICLSATPSGVMSVVHFLVFAIASTSHVLAIACGGLLLSVLCRTTLRAQVTLGACILAVTALPWWLLPTDAIYAQAAINPLYCWWSLTRQVPMITPYRSPEVYDSLLFNVSILIGAMMYLTLAVASFGASVLLLSSKRN